MDLTALAHHLKEVRVGDPYFIERSLAELQLYVDKNSDYAGHRAGEPVDPHGNFNRVAAFLSQYPGLSLADPRVIALVYALKQFDQVLWSLSRGFEGKVEGLGPRLQDISVYARIVQCIHRQMQLREAPTVTSEMSHE